MVSSQSESSPFLFRGFFLESRRKLTSQSENKIKSENAKTPLQLCHLIQCPAFPSPVLPSPAQPSPAQSCPAQPSPAQGAYFSSAFRICDSGKRFGYGKAGTIMKQRMAFNGGTAASICKSKAFSWKIKYTLRLKSLIFLAHC